MICIIPTLPVLNTIWANREFVPSHSTSLSLIIHRHDRPKLLMGDQEKDQEHHWPYASSQTHNGVCKQVCR